MCSHLCSSLYVYSEMETLCLCVFVNNYDFFTLSCKYLLFQGFKKRKEKLERRVIWDLEVRLIPLVLLKLWDQKDWKERKENQVPYSIGDIGQTVIGHHFSLSYHKHSYVHTHIHTYTHTVRTYKHTHIRTYKHTHIRTYTHTYMHMTTST